MFEGDKRRKGLRWWPPQATSLPFYEKPLRPPDNQPWESQPISTHELSSGKVESRVADIEEKKRK